MEINNMLLENLSSLKQAIGMAMLRKTMNQDSLTAASLIQGMESANTKVMEQSVTPYKGGNIDVRV